MTHLHRDYGTSFCGKDASHIPMTHDEAKADCKACKKALEQHREDVKAAKLAEEALAAKEAAQAEKLRNERDRRIAERDRMEEDRRRKIEEAISWAQYQP
jgi:hypothetical protein